MENIRNFSIIAHIDHGKSTLADRLLEVTKTIPERKMRAQVLDRMDLERERGITIKMTPVSMKYHQGGQDYVLNLIDTPGHIDFAYEVSRALYAVEGTLLLVDATQGVQAQTLSVLEGAKKANLTIIPVITKVDSPLARVEIVREEIVKLLSVRREEIILVSGRTGQGVAELLVEIVKRIPPPKSLSNKESRGLVFDFEYSNHQGIIMYVRVMDGVLAKGMKLSLAAGQKTFTSLSQGIFRPEKEEVAKLEAGMIGYVVSGIKEPGVAVVGDTVLVEKSHLPVLPGYERPRPVVFASLYLPSDDEYPLLKQGLLRLSLSDSSITYEEEESGVLGRGFRVGFLGMLHLEVVIERLRREFSIEPIVTTPSVSYRLTVKNKVPEIISSPALFPEAHLITKIEEPWTTVSIILPSDRLEALMPYLFEYEATLLSTENFSDGRISLTVEMPLRELMRNFFDTVKGVTAGFASFSYTPGEMREAEVMKMSILVADEEVPAFAKIVSKRKLESEAKKAVEKLAEILPKQLFVMKVQAEGGGRILASKTVKAFRKDVTAHLYGGDVTRKMKLREKQKEGKKRMRTDGKVNIPHEVFLKMVKD